ncbi:uncharacterized protein MYCGRDRAFT_94664 [Zymoseptoria tritici IPO323]|uniref:Extracellular membrane protein CFEM domain-containing protein n=1 Tax=Zymoseptoria tritici (strain CBS 115943 / IPO323) TaxID=336722 RepID=F9XGP2_ZYMTI|nr:uncharacterized protein MYCGRDRAFT_94664 [Zymoseptoria tritici IPO323]EGP85796.1 hypothetical protein MYCGRDRAFT_94664 [Zymoseptoria tritici IPO323]
MSLPASIFAAAAILLRITFANPDRGGPQSGDPSFPSCAYNCRPAASDYKSLCSATDTLETFKKCVSDNNCEEGDWEGLYQGLQKWCNLTSSVTSGSPPWPTPWPTNSDWTTRTAGDWQNGPFGPNNHGWGPPAWSTNSDWTRGPWTSWSDVKDLGERGRPCGSLRETMSDNERSRESPPPPAPASGDGVSSSAPVVAVAAAAAQVTPSAEDTSAPGRTGMFPFGSEEAPLDRATVFAGLATAEQAGREARQHRANRQRAERDFQREIYRRPFDREEDESDSASEGEEKGNRGGGGEREVELSYEGVLAMEREWDEVRGLRMGGEDEVGVVVDGEGEEWGVMNGRESRRLLFLRHHGRNRILPGLAISAALRGTSSVRSFRRPQLLDLGQDLVGGVDTLHVGLLVTNDAIADLHGRGHESVIFVCEPGERRVRPAGFPLKS